MIHHPDWSGELERLTQVTDDSKRGLEFETFIGSLFKHEHFQVTHNAGTAAPRQVDLLATRGADTFLVETKWWKNKKAGIDAVDSLIARVESTAANVIGVLVSHSGFTTPAVERVMAKAQRPILLVNGDEVERLARGEGITRLLERKKSALTSHRAVVFTDAPPKRSRGGRRGSLPRAHENFVFVDTDARSQWLASGGDFGRFVFARDLPDIDWVPGGGAGVSLDLAPSVADEGELLALLHRLNDMGWITPDASWSIQQSTANWHGMGAPAFVEALPEWPKRYEGREVHGTEEFCYFDVCGAGFYTLTGSIAAYKPRWVRGCRLSFQLPGVPLDVGPYRELFTTFELQEPAFYRPRNEPSVAIRHLSRESAVLTPIAYVVEEECRGDTKDDPEQWATGIVVHNPIRGMSAEPDGWLPAVAVESEYLVCDLRSWHPLSRPKSAYRVWLSEAAWTSDALVLRVLADWDDTPSTEGQGHDFRTHPSRAAHEGPPIEIAAQN